MVFELFFTLRSCPNPQLLDPDLRQGGCHEDAPTCVKNRFIVDVSVHYQDLYLIEPSNCSHSQYIAVEPREYFKM